MASTVKRQRKPRQLSQANKLALAPSAASDPVAHPIFSAAASPSARPTDSPYDELMKLVNFDETGLCGERMDILLTRPPRHTSAAGLNPLVDAAAYVFSSMGELARLRHATDLPALQVRLVEEIREFQQVLQEQYYRTAYLAEYIPIATYALCTTLNDIIAYTTWGSHGRWDAHCLLSAFHQEALSREHFLIILERFIQDQAIFMDMMEFIYICLSLGFKYSCHSSGFGAEQLQRLMHALYKRIRLYRGNFSKSLFPYSLRMTQPVSSAASQPGLLERLGSLLRVGVGQSRAGAVNRIADLHPVVLEQVEMERSYFASVSHYLASHSLVHKGTRLTFSDLPWVLMIGLPEAGKTTLMTNSRIKFLVNRQSDQVELCTAGQTNNWDWWVMPNAVLLDIPGAFVSRQSDNQVANQLWDNLLDMIEAGRGPRGVQGVALVMACSDLLDPLAHTRLIAQLTEGMADLTRRFGTGLPVNIIIGKCDLLTGFQAFFDDLTQDELQQPWGIRLPESVEQVNLVDVCLARWDALIKQLNQQLIYRLHQEKDFQYQEKFLIKDFPLQIESLKLRMAEVLRGLQAQGTSLSLRGIFLTSARQVPPAQQTTTLPQVISTEQTLPSLTIMETPGAPAQSYFIKQLLLSGLVPESRPTLPASTTRRRWLKPFNKPAGGTRYGS